MSWGTPNYIDSLTGSARIGLPVYSSPIPSTNAEYVLEEPWQGLRTTYTPLALNTQHPEDSNFVLVGESERRDAGGGQVQWVRRYAKKPATWDEWENYIYNFIGFFGSYGVNVTTVSGRPRQALPVMSRIQHDYYLVGAEAWADYATPGDIPFLLSQKYRISSSSWWMDVDWVGDSDVLVNPSTPTRTTYVGYCKNAIDHGWGAGTVSYDWNSDGVTAPVVTAGTNPGQIVAEDSRLSRWLGNIWLRQTRYVLAQ